VASQSHNKARVANEGAEGGRGTRPITTKIRKNTPSDADRPHKHHSVIIQRSKNDTMPEEGGGGKGKGKGRSKHLRVSQAQKSA
jgi:hypothetical protein